MSSWAKRNGCTTPYEQEDTFDGDVHHLIWTCKDQYGAVQHYKTDDQSKTQREESIKRHLLIMFETEHDWPSTEPNFSQLAAGDLPTHIQASKIIQEFFMNFTRPAQ